MYCLLTCSEVRRLRLILGIRLMGFGTVGVASDSFDGKYSAWGVRSEYWKIKWMSKGLWFFKGEGSWMFNMVYITLGWKMKENDELFWKEVNRCRREVYISRESVLARFGRVLVTRAGVVRWREYFNHFIADASTSCVEQFQTLKKSISLVLVKWINEA